MCVCVGGGEGGGNLVLLDPNIAICFCSDWKYLVHMYAIFISSLLLNRDKLSKERTCSPRIKIFKNFLPKGQILS